MRSEATWTTTRSATSSTQALERAGLAHLRWLTPPSDDEPDGVLREDAIVFHDLRHTFGTQCAAKGIDLRRIQAWMGHADIQTTMRYLHYVPAHDDAARLTAAFTAETLPRDSLRTGDTRPQLSATQQSERG
jgi:integrase